MVIRKLLIIASDDDLCASISAHLASAKSGTSDMRIATARTIEDGKVALSESEIDLVVFCIFTDLTSDYEKVDLSVKLFLPTPVVVWAVTGNDNYDPSVLQGDAAGLVINGLAPAYHALKMLELIVENHTLKREKVQQQLESGITLEAIADGVICTNSRGEITFLNSAARRLLLAPFDSVIGKPITDLMRLQDPRTRESIVHPSHQVIASMQTTRVGAGTVLVRNDGSEITIEDCVSPIIAESGSMLGTVMVFHDTTEAYKMQSEVDYLAWHDFLTGLPNRFAIRKHIDQTLAHATAHHQHVPVLYLDLDKFKLVNDTLGHGVGDLLLASVAERLRSCFRLIDLIGREGGDEFIVVLAPGSTVDEAANAAARIIEALTLPHELSGNTIRVGCSTGIAMFPEHGTTVETILNHADTALQSAKASGRNTWRVYSYDLETEARERRRLEEALRTAITDGSFTLFYQPKVEMTAGRMCGCEALVRWNHPDWGWVPPIQFIPCAEDSGLIVALGRWVFAEAIRQAHEWMLQGQDVDNIAVNVSAEELGQPGFVEHIRNTLHSVPIDPSMIQIEMTESVLIHDIEHAKRCLHQLKDIGLTLVIDDFGTGYSSLSYLADFPIDVLKIDRSFVHGVHRAGSRQQALLQAILTMAKSLSLQVVAEGIETVDEAEFLKSAGCEIGQGYLYSQPVDAQSIDAFLMEHNRNGGAMQGAGKRRSKQTGA